MMSLRKNYTCLLVSLRALQGWVLSENFPRNLLCPALILTAGYPAAGKDLALLRSDLKKFKKLSFFDFFRILDC